MLSGLQFSNLNRYRRYPFADDSDLSVKATLYTYHEEDPTQPEGYSPVETRTVLIPDSFFRMFRAVVVHAGDKPVKEVRLAGIELIPDKALSFQFFDSDGNKVMFNCKDDVFDGDVRIVVSNPDGVNAVQVADFNFSHCISLCFDVRFDDLFRNFGFLRCSCSIPFAAGTLLAMEAPHVMSLMDDSGNMIRDEEQVKLVAGYNVKLDVMSGPNTIIVTPLKGAGAGRPYNESGISTAFSQLNLRSVNGVGADASGNVSIVGGNGMAVEPVPGTNIVNVHGNSGGKSAQVCGSK